MITRNIDRNNETTRTQTTAHGINYRGQQVQWSSIGNLLGTWTAVTWGSGNNLFYQSITLNEGLYRLQGTGSQTGLISVVSGSDTLNYCLQLGYGASNHLEDFTSNSYLTIEIASDNTDIYCYAAGVDQVGVQYYLYPIQSNNDPLI